MAWASLDEGIFLRVCEITLSVLRMHKETLMSVLETFVHDPLVEWTKSHKSSGVEVQNPHAQRPISNIEARLQGVVVGVGAAPSLPLAVEGFDACAIKKATPIDLRYWRNLNGPAEIDNPGVSQQQKIRQSIVWVALWPYGSVDPSKEASFVHIFHS
ncbi:hypothetical protein ACFX15_003333 [Malus domestica]